MKIFIIKASSTPYEYPVAVMVIAEDSSSAIEIAEKKFLTSQLPLRAKEVPFEEGVFYEDINYG